MKIRIGFVTNSSSSSFIAISINKDFFEDILEKNRQEIIKKLKNNPKFNQEYVDDYIDCDNLLGGLQMLYGEDRIEYIGYDAMPLIKSNNTLNEMQNKLLNVMKEYYPELNVTVNDIYLNYGSYYC